MTTAVPMSAVVLSGGTSRRMGADKALIQFEGDPLVLRSARLVGTVADQVIVASGPSRRLAAHLRGTPFEEVEDVVPTGGPAARDAGPLGGIVAGLRAARHPIVAVLAVDMPFASPSLFRLLAGLIGRRDAAVPVTSEGSQPLHAVYAARSWRALEEALERGTRSVRTALEGLDVRWVAEGEWRAADASGRFALNLNERADMTAIGIEPASA